MSAEAIAKVIADIRADRALVPQGAPHPEGVGDFEWPVVDATSIYEALVARDDPIWIYEDHPSIAPPWDAAAICYVNQHGNVIVMLYAAPTADDIRWDSDTNEVDWDRVRWKLHAYVYVGGRSQHKPSLTVGPVHMWQFAIYENGEPADLHWVQLAPEYPMTNWDMAQLVLLGSLNFLNCRNVELVEPYRPRAEKRRIARTGVTVSTINVFPISRSSRSRGENGSSGVPLTSVRGHFASYGPEYDRGLLFGKIAGRFWIPQYARGSEEHGRTEHDYVLRKDNHVDSE